MPWEKRRGKRYFYKAIRRQGQPRKRYFGCGTTATLAADLFALQHGQRQAAHAQAQAQARRVQTVGAGAQALQEACELLASAVLLLAGFHRPSRHAWRVWRHGRRILYAAGGTPTRG